MYLTSAVTLLKSALVSPTKASLPGRESATLFIYLFFLVATEKRKWANAVTTYQPIKKVKAVCTGTVNKQTLQAQIHNLACSTT